MTTANVRDLYGLDSLRAKRTPRNVDRVHLAYTTMTPAQPAVPL